MLLKAVLILLVLVTLLLVYIVFKVHRAFRNLTEKRLTLYTSHLGELHETMSQLRRGKKPEFLEANRQGQFELVASMPVLKLSGEVLDDFLEISKSQQDCEPADEIAIAIKAAEQKLVNLHVALRTDLALDFGECQFPSAPVFRRNREAR